jgi:hypothetical protein
MVTVQTVFGLVLILIALAALGFAVGLACWLVLFAVRWLPLIGRRHRHAHWDALNQRDRLGP